MSERLEAITKMLEEQGQPSYTSARTFRLLTSDFKEWRPKENDNYINIIPPIDPKALFVFKVFVHYRVGGSDHFVCPKYMHNDPCPVCEEREKLKKKLGVYEKYPQEIKDLFPSARALYMVVDTSDDKEIDKGIQLWLAPYDSVQDKGIAELCKAKRGQGAIDISDPKLALDIQFTKQGNTKETTKYFGFRTVESRINAEEFYNERPDSYDELLVYATYDDIYKALHSVSGEQAKAEIQPETNSSEDVPVDVPSVEQRSNRIRRPVDKPASTEGSESTSSVEDKQEQLRKLRQEVRTRAGLS